DLRRAAPGGRCDLRLLRETRLRAFSGRARGHAEPLVESSMRACCVILLFMLCTAASAQQSKRPPKLEPLPEPPPPPAMSDPDEPAVNIPIPQGHQIEEMREG